MPLRLLYLLVVRFIFIVNHKLPSILVRTHLPNFVFESNFVFLSNTVKFFHQKLKVTCFFWSLRKICRFVVSDIPVAISNNIPHQFSKINE